MKNSTLALVFKTAVITTLLNFVAQSAHASTFTFELPNDAVRTDGDRFSLTLTYEDTLITEFSESHKDESNWVPPTLTSPAYTFTGYRVTSVTGTYTEGVTEYPIVGLLSKGSIVSHPGDKIPHSPIDNLFNPPSGAPGHNPDGGFATEDFEHLPQNDTERMFSFGGIGFNVREGTVDEPYQLFARSDFNSTWSNPPGFHRYAGCPGSCFGVVIPEPITILGSATALGFGAFFKRKLKTSK